MNRLSGTILAMDTDGGVAMVKVEAQNCPFTAIILSATKEHALWQPGEKVCLLFKETEVSLAKGLAGLISLRNRHGGVIEKIQRGKLISRVVFLFAGVTLSAIITTGSVERLALAVGDEIEWLVKANEMAVERISP